MGSPHSPSAPAPAVTTTTTSTSGGAASAAGHSTPLYGSVADPRDISDPHPSLALGMALTGSSSSSSATTTSAPTTPQKPRPAPLDDSDHNYLGTTHHQQQQQQQQQHHLPSAGGRPPPSVGAVAAAYVLPQRVATLPGGVEVSPSKAARDKEASTHGSSSAGGTTQPRGIMSTFSLFG